MSRIGINIHEKRIVRQVGYLQECHPLTVHFPDNVRYEACDSVGEFSFCTPKKKSILFFASTISDEQNLI
jgi:hypothetical protein